MIEAAVAPTSWNDEIRIELDQENELLRIRQTEGNHEKKGVLFGSLKETDYLSREKPNALFANGIVFTSGSRGGILRPKVTACNYATIALAERNRSSQQPHRKRCRQSRVQERPKSFASLSDEL